MPPPATVKHVLLCPPLALTHSIVATGYLHPWIVNWIICIMSLIYNTALDTEWRGNGILLNE